MKIGVPKWIKILMYIENDNMANVSRKLGCTYSHLSKIVNQFKQKGWVSIMRNGRANVVTLTEKGTKIKDACQTIAIELNINGYQKC